jgi:hypothetical protein
MYRTLRRMVAELNQRFPDATLLNNIWLPTIRAKIALSRGDSAQAINLLEAAIPYDLSQPPTAVFLCRVTCGGKHICKHSELMLRCKSFKPSSTTKACLGLPRRSRNPARVGASPGPGRQHRGRQNRLPGFFRLVERRGPGPAAPQTSQGGERPLVEKRQRVSLRQGVRTTQNQKEFLPVLCG